MERVEVLIHKLVAQQAAGESAAQLFLTAQALYQELISLQPQTAVPVSKRVAVIMPSIPFVSTEAMSEAPTKESISPAAEVIEKQLEINEMVIAQAEELKEANLPKTDPYTLRKPVVEEIKPSEPPVVLAPPTVAPSFQKPELPFDPIEDVPTLRQAATSQKKELHEMLGGSQESLNDKLKEDKTELAHSLKTEPIKDLRKGIGVNDKFLFINELFRGDEAMYERSIKTINAFHILPEAEYWINRELKVKLGWSDTKDTVQHFYAVVRRRFS
ncbi:MAG: hypothetical protein JWP69_154 [Flaviaesturariibacter sp.]|nr:hypothetical protein [Flaviaesturariibacter sp.]